MNTVKIFMPPLFLVLALIPPAGQADAEMEVGVIEKLDRYIPPGCQAGR